MGGSLFRTLFSSLLDSGISDQEQQVLGATYWNYHSCLKVSCTVISIFTKEVKTYKKLQSALDNLPIIKSEVSYKTDKSEMAGNRATFKKPISYSKCGKSFISRNNLNTHEQIHNGEDPFCCTKCDKKFKESGKLKIHERIHTDEKPFSCTMCDKKFATSSNLKIHERIHTEFALRLKIGT